MEHIIANKYPMYFLKQIIMNPLHWTSNHNSLYGDIMIALKAVYCTLDTL